MNRFKSIYFVHLGIFLMFIFYISIVFREFSEIHEINFGFGKDYSFKSVLTTLTTHSLFKGFLVLMPPLVGVFLKNRFGWFLVTGYVYFVLVITIIQISFDNYVDLELILFIIVLISILLSFLLILNFKKSSIQYYKAFEMKLLEFNTISFTYGLSMAIISFIWNNRHHLDTLNL